MTTTKTQNLGTTPTHRIKGTKARTAAQWLEVMENLLALTATAKTPTPEMTLMHRTKSKALP
jgi:hypothetical protein